MNSERPAQDAQRRPQWRGERKAVLVRMPVEAADLLARTAAERNLSVSEHAAHLLAAALNHTDAA